MNNMQRSGTLDTNAFRHGQGVPALIVSHADTGCGLILLRGAPRAPPQVTPQHPASNPESKVLSPGASEFAVETLPRPLLNSPPLKYTHISHQPNDRCIRTIRGPLPGEISR